MNRADVAMVDQQLNQLGQTLLQQRQMQQTGQYQQAELKYRQLAEQAAVNRYEAQQQHWNTMESQGERNDAQRNANADSANANESTRLQQQANQQDLQQKQGLLQSMIQLNSTGQLDDDARDRVNDFLAKDEHFGGTGIQLSAPDPELLKRENAESAITNTLRYAQTMRDAAKQATNPEDVKQYGYWQKLAEDSLPAALATQRQLPTEKDTTYGTEGLNAGKPVRTVTQRLPGAGVPNSGTGAPNPWPVAPTDRSQLVPGQRYVSPANPNMSATWNGQTWDNSPPTIQVPGLGAAQAPQ